MRATPFDSLVAMPEEFPASAEASLGLALPAPSVDASLGLALPAPSVDASLGLALPAPSVDASLGLALPAPSVDASLAPFLATGASAYFVPDGQAHRAEGICADAADASTSPTAALKVSTRFVFISSSSGDNRDSP